jgi:RNase H-fold protein (predicted Holliday junction resolvase)
MENIDAITTARALGVDPGAVRIGLALCDELGCMAYPLRTLKASP